jgi:hypothetical protein
MMDRGGQTRCIKKSRTAAITQGISKEGLALLIVFTKTLRILEQVADIGVVGLAACK